MNIPKSRKGIHCGNRESKKDSAIRHWLSARCECGSERRYHVPRCMDCECVKFVKGEK